jgi:TRAP-type C4-dicarboxylate transport system permease small subunit
MKKIELLINTIEIRLCQTFLVFIIVFVFSAALMRWVGYPLVWSVDLAQLLFVWICFFGADIALRNDRHIGVDLFVKKMPDKYRRTLQISTYILVIAFLSIIAVYGAYLAVINHRRQFSGMEFSYSWATSSAPVGCFLMIRTLVTKMIPLFSEPSPEGCL